MFTMYLLNIRKTFSILNKALILAVLLACVHVNVALAQEAQVEAQDNTQKTAPQSRVFKAKARAAEASMLVAGTTKIHLWGIENIDFMPANFRLVARATLDRAIGPEPVECELKERRQGMIYAQCVNGAQQDLALLLLQQGYATAARGDVYGTAYEDAYIQAEQIAQNRQIGLWANAQKTSSSQGGSDPNLFLTFAFILFVGIVAAFSVLSVIIMRGFKKVIDAQNQNYDFLAKERKLKDKERGIVATMIDSELKANKAKIEAYLVVYDEMLKALKDPERPPKYKKAGDIVQKQPAIDRSVFDRNTDKLDSLGQELSNNLIHFYARLKTKPEYINLEPDMDLPQAIEIVEKSVNNAQRLNKMAEDLIEAFQSATPQKQ